jgi:hypothetical protein
VWPLLVASEPSSPATQGGRGRKCPSGRYKHSCRSPYEEGAKGLLALGQFVLFQQRAPSPEQTEAMQQARKQLEKARWWLGKAERGLRG